MSLTGHTNTLMYQISETISLVLLSISVRFIFDDPSDMLWAQECLTREVFDEHAPLKSKTVRASEPPYMNKTLKKAIMNKVRLQHRFKKKLKRLGRCFVNKETKPHPSEGNLLSSILEKDVMVGLFF